MYDALATKLDASDLRIAIAISRYHSDITTALLDDATQTFREASGREDTLQTVDAPGAWELTVICRALVARQPAFDAVVALGCILTGETTHDQYIAQSVTQGLTALSVETGIPIAFGVLTCQSMAQARARAGLETRGAAGAPRRGKGMEAMRAAIAAALAVRTIREHDRSVR